MIASLGCHQKISWSLMFHFYDQDRDACNNECTLVCLYHISYNAQANQKKRFPRNKGQRHKDGLQMSICSDFILLNILRWSFLLL